MEHDARKLGLVSAIALVVAACGGEPGVGSDESDMTASSSRSKTLNPTIAVPTDNDIGRSIDDVRAQLVAGAQPYNEQDVPWGDGVCHQAYYEVEGWSYVNLEDCPGDSRILRAYRSGNLPEVVWADHDYDGRVDSWVDDDIDGFRHKLTDDNHDGRVDFESTDMELLGADFVIEGYGACTPPEYLAMRILEDTNFDGYFDTESITGGKAPDGSYSWWMCE